MIGRREFGIAGLSALALASSEGFALAQKGAKKSKSAPHAERLDEGQGVSLAADLIDVPPEPDGAEGGQ